MSTVYYNGQEYQTRPLLSETGGLLLATAASSAIVAPLPYIGKSFQKQLNKEIPNNHFFKESFFKAFDISGLKEKGVSLVEAQFNDVPLEYKLGQQACYDPFNKQVILNTDKISSAGFHELGHALNSLKSKYGIKYLAKLRAPGYVIAGLMEYFAIFSRTKPKDTKRNVTDIIEDNCGKIAFLAMMPTVIEEAVASYRGIKLAKKSGVPEPLIKNMKKIYLKAHTTYSAKAVLGGLAVYASRKIMDYFTRPRPVEQPSQSFFFG